MPVHAFIFPGQGSQAVGMGAALADASRAAKDVFAEVDEALGQNLFRLMRDGPEDELKLTENAQPAIMAHSIAVLRTMGVSIGDVADFVAGHSLGEYSALCAARSFDLATTAKLLKLRGRAMQQAVPVGEGAMAALLGADLVLAQPGREERHERLEEVLLGSIELTEMIAPRHITDRRHPRGTGRCEGRTCCRHTGSRILICSQYASVRD
jgi:malonyl CoA-acyl carrier protein transacylase